MNDGAAQAFATLDFSLGETQISISRDLATLSPVALVVDGEEFGVDEEVYRSVSRTEQGSRVSSTGCWFSGTWSSTSMTVALWYGTPRRSGGCFRCYSCLEELLSPTPN